MVLICAIMNGEANPTLVLNSMECATELFGKSKAFRKVSDHLYAVKDNISYTCGDNQWFLDAVFIDHIDDGTIPAYFTVDEFEVGQPFSSWL